MGNPVVHFEIMGSDHGQALASFYAGLFGWTVEPVESSGDRYRIVRTDAGSGIDGGIGDFPGAPSYVTVYVQTDDLAGTLERVTSMGGEVFAEPRQVAPGVSSALFRDPAGHLIGLISSSS
jgi:uncharacterized protein